LIRSIWFYLDCHHDHRDGADETQTDADRMSRPVLDASTKEKPPGGRITVLCSG
jgi:hypothetical protein